MGRGRVRAEEAAADGERQDALKLADREACISKLNIEQAGIVKRDSGEPTGLLEDLASENKFFSTG